MQNNAIFDRFNDAIIGAMRSGADIPTSGPEVVHALLSVAGEIARVLRVGWVCSLACHIAVSGISEDEAVAEVRTAFAAKRGDIGSVTS